MTPRSMEEHAREIIDRGYTVVENMLSPEQLSEARDAIETVFAMEEEVGIARGWQNDMYKVAYLLPNKHPLFVRFPLYPKLISLVKSVLGKDVMMSSLNGLTMVPGCENQKLHYDQPQTPGICVTINALHCLDDFTRANGCTRVIPGSDRSYFDFHQPEEQMESKAVYIEAPAGSLIAYNGGLIHAGSSNKTDRQRRAIHAFFARAWVKPQWDYTRSLKPEVIESMTPEQLHLFALDRHVPWYNYATDQVMRSNMPEPAHKPARLKEKAQ